MKFRLLILAVLAAPLVGQDTELDDARQVNLERAAAMPNFVADEVSKRYTGYSIRGGPAKWKFKDTVEVEITVKGTEVTRQKWRRNGKPGPLAPGFYPGAGFGAELKPLFSPDCPTMLAAAGHEEVSGKSALVYRFSSPAGGCFGFLYGASPFNAARAGRVLVEEASGSILRFEEEATGFPAGFAFVQRNQIMTWGSVSIGDTSHWLPEAADFIWRQANGELYRVTIEYKNHRHFEAATNITFK